MTSEIKKNQFMKNVAPGTYEAKNSGKKEP